MRHVDRKKRKTRRTAVASRLMSSAAMILLALAAAANGQGVKPGTPPPPPISIKAKPLQAFLGPETFAVQATGKRTPPNSATKLKATPDATIVAASGGCSPSPVTQGSTLTCTIDAGVSGQGAPPSGSVTLQGLTLLFSAPVMDIPASLSRPRLRLLCR
jgi:hypothetical protein